MGTQAVSKQVSIQDFVLELRKFPETAFDRTDQIAKFLENVLVAPDTLAPYLTWDGQHYTRNLIDKTPLYELMAICWEVGQGSSVHNHKDQNCWMAVPIGRLLVENYRVIVQKLERRNVQTRARGYRRNEPNSSLRRRSPGASPSRLQSARVQPPRGQPACIFPAIR